MTNKEAIKMLKSKMDGHTDTSYEWAETVRMAIKALEQELCEDCISRERTMLRVREFIGNPTYTEKMLVDDLNALPSVTPKEKTGKWIIMSSEICKCSKCELFSDKVTKFCPNCGAKMIEP